MSFSDSDSDSESITQNIIPNKSVVSIDVGTRNLAICVLEYNRERSSKYPFTIKHWELLDLNSFNSPYVATTNMIKQFMSRQYLYSDDITHVLIESQDASVDLMKRLASAIQSHFETHWAISLSSSKVVFCHGASKLNLYSESDRVDLSSKSKSNHDYNKTVAKKHCKKLLEYGCKNNWVEYNQFKNWYTALPKKDDVADALLQGGYYLLKHNSTKDQLKAHTKFISKNNPRKKLKTQK